MAIDQNITANQRIKYLKLGRRMTDYANDQIRAGLMTRDECIPLVEKYDGKCNTAYFKKIAKYMEISYEDLWGIIDQFVNKSLFEDGNRLLIPLFKVGDGLWGLK